MQSLLTDFRLEFIERILEILWSQWTSLGIASHGRRWKGSVIDPEALLIFSCTFARYDARLFDAMLEWLTANGRYLNIQRIKRMLREETFAGEAVLQPIADTIKTSVNEVKWARITEKATSDPGQPEPLFYLKDGRHLPVVGNEDPVFENHGFLRDLYEKRGVAQKFRPEPVSNMLLRLRSFLGVNSRCEIILFLLLNDCGSPRAMAADCYYFPATMSKTLAEMKDSGFLVSRAQGRHRFYSLTPDLWKTLFIKDGVLPAWMIWARLFSALEQVWLFLNDGGMLAKSPLAQASSLRRILKRSVISRFDQSGLPFVFGDEAAHPGEALITFFIKRMKAILDEIEGVGGK